eukprot:TRINITY_DN2135_c0_g1_i1.p1 TRINITY_DN2135_c0_g1~~TRINITY_DN2135_c0_g1_i1.p1  ORF type:complete len:535 (-),score=134.62 TRINITY_DN2135_c0_g1_i1:39-1643(-)
MDNFNEYEFVSTFSDSFSHVASKSPVIRQKMKFESIYSQYPFIISLNKKWENHILRFISNIFSKCSNDHTIYFFNGTNQQLYMECINIMEKKNLNLNSNLFEKTIIICVITAFLMKLNHFYSLNTVSKVFNTNEELIMVLSEFFAQLLSQSKCILLDEGFDIYPTIFDEDMIDSLNSSFCKYITFSNNEIVTFWRSMFQRKQINYFFVELLDIINKPKAVDSPNSTFATFTQSDDEKDDFALLFSNGTISTSSFNSTPVESLSFSQESDNEYTSDLFFDDDNSSFFKSSRQEMFLSHLFEIIVNFDFFSFDHVYGRELARFCWYIVEICVIDKVNERRIVKDNSIVLLDEKFDHIVSFFYKFLGNVDAKKLNFSEFIVKEYKRNNLNVILHMSRCFARQRFIGDENIGNENFLSLFYEYYLIQQFLRQKLNIDKPSIGFYNPFNEKFDVDLKMPLNIQTSKDINVDIRKSQIKNAVLFARNIQNNGFNQTHLKPIENKILTLLIEGFPPSLICSMTSYDINTSYLSKRKTKSRI